MTTYYVNYATGSDTNSGTSAYSPWKHAPGDPNATGNVKKADLVGGDEVLFKGGVVYQGSISVPASGTAGKPIVYEGTGWGTGQAILSGLTSVQLNFTVDPANSKLSVATLPTGMVPTGLSTGVLSAQDNIVEIDGNVAQMANTSTSSNPYFPDLGATSFPSSEMQGSGSSWTFTDPTLGAELAGLSTAQIDNLIFRTYVYGNMDINMSVTGFNAKTDTLSLSGSYQAPSSGFSYTLLNDPNSVSASNPYSEYGIEGNQIIAAVTPGAHTVSVSTAGSGYGFQAGGKSNITIDGFDISGYGGSDGCGMGIHLVNGQNIQVTNNTLSNIYTHTGYGYSALEASGVSNVTISGNTVGPNIHGAGIAANSSTNASVIGNTITSPGWTGIVAFDDVNTAISQNRISNTFGVHASGIIAFDTNTTQQSQNVSITNNQIENGNGGIFIEGDPARSGPSATPNNFTIAYNVITNQAGDGIGDWGKTNTANIYGNILMNTAPVNVIGNSENISWYDNIFQAYPYINPTSPPAGNTFSNNVALTAKYLQTDVNNTAPFGVNNTVNTALASILQQALGTPGVLPTSIGSILRPAGSGAIGIDYSTSLAAPGS